MKAEWADALAQLQATRTRNYKAQRDILLRAVVQIVNDAPGGHSPSRFVDYAVRLPGLASQAIRDIIDGP